MIQTPADSAGVFCHWPKNLEQSWNKVGTKLEMEIITIKRHGTASNDAENVRHEPAENRTHETKHETKHGTDVDIYGGSPDAEFMKMCAKWDMNPPETWKNYDTKTEAGIKKVIEMEYRELADAKTEKDTMTNIYHLSVALLRLWRLKNEQHKQQPN